MKKFPYLRTTFTAALISLAAPLSHADEITLRDGTKYDGEVVSEDTETLKVRVSRGKGITKIETIRKADILKREQATPDKLEAEELRKLIPAPDDMSDTAYQKVLTEQIIPFLNKYPKSPYRAEIEKIRDTYLEEKARAQKGEKKIEGQWISAEEQSWNDYNISARRKRLALERQIAEGNIREAYRIFVDLERDRPASVEFVKALQAISAALPEYEKELAQAFREVPIIRKRRDEYIKTLTPENKRAYEANLKSASDKIRLEIEEAKKIRSDGGLLPYDPYDEKSIDAAQKALLKEQQRLSKFDVDELRNATEAFQKGLKDYHEKRYDMAVRNFKIATSVSFIQNDRTQFVKQQVDAATKAAQEAARASREAGVAPTFTGAAAPATPPSATPKPAVREPAKTDAGAPVRSAPAADGEAVADEEYIEDEPESNMPLYLMIGAAVVLVAGLIAKFLSQKKASGGAE